MIMIRRMLGLALMVGLVACGGDDTKISEAVRSRLAAEGLSDQVHVETTRRVVVLEGVVSDPQEQSRAELAARTVQGVMAVDNRLTVKNVVEVTGGTVDAAKR